MTGIEALELLFQGEKIYRGYFQSECDQWFIQYNKDNRTFTFGAGWNESLKYKNSQEIMNFILTVIYSDHWKKSSE